MFTITTSSTTATSTDPMTTNTHTRTTNCTTSIANVIAIASAHALTTYYHSCYVLLWPRLRRLRPRYYYDRFYA
eukprot:3836462-Pyramimonas_sp.AAC.1